MSPLLAQSGHDYGTQRCPLLEVKRTFAPSYYDLGGHTALGGTMKHWTFGITPSP